ncbi:hypothetical protein [Malikia sp.]|uniref:hypothetical protein n=1 Tax=Malikia sp. TaxID=2070706 RepID=UPI0026164F04|nr:hypothetical protein [Malikia sp.]
MPPSTLRILAALALLLGLACAVVNGWFFALGLDRLEPDATARTPLLLAGWLMVATEHVAVGLAALLPAALAGLRRRLLWLGLALLTFECVSMFTAQRALEHVNVVATSAQATHAADLRAAIDSQRATLEQLRDNGTRQSESTNGWRQHLGATALRDSLAGQQQLQALESELAALQGGIRPTLTGVLGESGASAFAAARALLIGVMGLVLMGAAGQLWAATRPESAVQPAGSAATGANRHARANSAQALPRRVPPPATTAGATRAGSNWPPWSLLKGQIPPKRPPRPNSDLPYLKT